jgi:VIT1/CCC1 family predicted Fe2+/Mn2+ transporter
VADVAPMSEQFRSPAFQVSDRLVNILGASDGIEAASRSEPRSGLLKRRNLSRCNFSMEKING